MKNYKPKPEAPLSIEEFQNSEEGFWYYIPEIMLYIKEQREKSKPAKWMDIRINIAKKFKRVIRSEDFLRKKYNHIEREKDLFKDILNAQDIYVHSYKNAFKNFDKLVQRQALIYKPSAQTDKTKTIVFGDSHAPFHNKEMLAYMIAHHKDAHTVILTGDMLDCYSASAFQKDIAMSLEDEIIEDTLMMDIIAKTWKNVIILKGNHDDRPARYFKKRIDPGMMFLVQTDLISLITKKHPNVTVVDTAYEFPNGMGGTHIGHFYKHGNDFIVGHFENAKKEPVKTVQECYKHLIAWEAYFKIAPVKMFLQAHSHSLGKWYRKGGSLVIGETGCSCQIQGYQTKPKIGWEPNVPGYWVVYQDSKGNTDLSRSQPFTYGEW